MSNVHTAIGNRTTGAATRKPLRSASEIGVRVVRKLLVKLSSLRLALVPQPRTRWRLSAAVPASDKKRPARKKS